MTIAHKVLENGATMPERPAYYVKQGGAWKATTWKGYADEVRAAAKSLITLGVEPGDTVNILGFNRPEWVIMDVAAIAVGAVPVGIYTTNSPRECQYILGHSEAGVVLVEDRSQWDKIAQVRGELPGLRTIVLMKGEQIDDDMTLAWEDFMAHGAAVADEQLEARLEGLQLDDLATLIYTSGTTGPPKGVMLSNDNIAWTPAQVLDDLGIGPDDKLVSYLPLSHIAEQSFTISAAALRGYAVYFAESIMALPDNLKEVRPTIFFAVPRVWERFHAKVAAALDEQEGLKASVLNWARPVAQRANELKAQGKEPPRALALQYKVAAKILAKVQEEMGLDQARVLATAAAPISGEILEFFAGLDLFVYEIYGQSEGTGPTTINLPGRARLGTVGPPFPGVDVKIADDGEILVKGRNVFLGYYKSDEDTKETLVDGWLHSGDLGEFDDDGFLHITGRKKDIIITAGGKNVAPVPIETELKTPDLITEVVIIGDRRKFLSAVVTLDEEVTAAYMAEHGITGAPHESAEIRAEVQKSFDAVNEHLARVEQIKKFTILPRPLSIEEGELTPTLKVKRNKVTEHFAAEIEAMYAE
jgi:long-chain acyl-CoA synthetase